MFLDSKIVFFDMSMHYLLSFIWKFKKYMYQFYSIKCRRMKSAVDSERQNIPYFCTPSHQPSIYFITLFWNYKFL